MAKLIFLKEGEKSHKPEYNKILKRRKIYKTIGIISGVLNALFFAFILYMHYNK